MKNLKKLLIVGFTSWSCFACINAGSNVVNLTDKVINQFVSSKPIDTGEPPLQIIKDSFEVAPDNDLIFSQTVKVFKLSNGECLSLVTLYNESGFGGYQSLLIFKNEKITTSLQRGLRFYAENGAINEKDIKYDDLIDDSKATQSYLKEDFNRYKQQFNFKVQSTCK